MVRLNPHHFSHRKPAEKSLGKGRGRRCYIPGVMRTPLAEKPSALAWQLYVHVPFCERKCHYCDFASWESPGVTQRAWVETVLRELDHAAARRPELRLDTVFFGGGTPSVLPVASLARIVARMRERFDCSGIAEMTLEANPSSLTQEKLRAWRGLGFDRVSIGVQSFDAEELRLLGRVHSPEGAEAALEALAAESGLRFSADLIFGLPGQTREGFLNNLEKLLRYHPGHVSFYGLTVEDGTEFARRQAAGRLVLPEAEAYGAMYRSGVERLRQSGWRRYEVSNFARPGQECRHNQGYWRGAPFLALGPGAHGFDGTRRWMNPRELDDYLRWGEAGFSEESVTWDVLDADAGLSEAVSLGLRQARGFDSEAVGTAFGVHWPESAWVKWERAGCLERVAGFARLGDEGWLLLDEICADLLAKARPVKSLTHAVAMPV